MLVLVTSFYSFNISFNSSYLSGKGGGFYVVLIGLGLGSGAGLLEGRDGPVGLTGLDLGLGSCQTWWVGDYFGLISLGVDGRSVLTGVSGICVGSMHQFQTEI